MFKRKTIIPVLFWYFEYVSVCVCMGICICKCGCINVYLYIDSIFKWTLSEQINVCINIYVVLLLICQFNM